MFPNFSLKAILRKNDVKYYTIIILFYKCFNNMLIKILIKDTLCYDFYILFKYLNYYLIKILYAMIFILYFLYYILFNFIFIFYLIFYLNFLINLLYFIFYLITCDSLFFL